MKSKKLTLTIIVFSVAFCCYSQNATFGVSGGLLNGSGKVKDDSSSASSSDTGFYLGLYSKIYLNEKISLIPEADYGNLNDSSFGFLSARLGYYIAPKFYFQGGPQITYLFDALTDDVSKTGLDVSLGLGYEITDKFHVQARYSFEVSNRVKNTETDLTAKLNWLHIGIGYSF
ncbi:outer membrane beta-barrel protein [Allomuricauda sp. M10]|uniref:outer membrane beta-barrel protein n=1 Tax=Allomuricauda sp. M10 TaxID=2683292 RepID=UPI001D191053|nr:outer membrane beta-barrel protein [Muricauda sp. M10]